MNFHGFLVGLYLFAMVDIFKVLVVKSKCRFGSRIWPVFLLVGFLCLFGSVAAADVLLSSILSITGFLGFWSVGELSEIKEDAEESLLQNSEK